MPALDEPACRWLGQWQEGVHLEIPPPPIGGGDCESAPTAAGTDAPRGALTFDPRADAGRVDMRTPDVRGGGPMILDIGDRVVAFGRIVREGHPPVEFRSTTEFHAAVNNGDLAEAYDDPGEEDISGVVVFADGSWMTRTDSVWQDHRCPSAADLFGKTGE